ncbi:hypothetical protein K5549_007751 [Capra hircus]|nr:hypothetical protein K5549_007751 [Capra hircus]
MRNHTELSEFILLGIPQTEGLETVLLVIFSFIYPLTLLGNLLILLAIMLFYLSGQSRAISYKGCAVQLFFYHFLGSTEGCLYSVMAYDRFVAICHPLRYKLIMGPGVCVGLVMAAWLVGCLQATILTSFTFELPYCGPNRVDHFFCDIPAVLPLACADSSFAQGVASTSVGFLALMLWLSICASYTRIGIAILRIRSAEGRQKAFSTCSAHLTAILCAFGPIIIVYLQPTPNPLLDAMVQLLNNTVSPMLNSLIYSLRNKEVKSSLKRIFHNVVLLFCTKLRVL